LTCDEIRPLLHGYVDGELDLVRSLEIERHLSGCPACAAALESHQALHSALQDASLYHRAPARLAARVRSSLPRAGKPRAAVPVLLWRSLAVAASLAFVALAVWGVVRLLSGRPAEDSLAQQVYSSHVRSLMDGNLLGVASSDQHTVKPWFDGRVPFSFAVKTPKGFPLEGGRLDYLDNRRVAVLIYTRRLHKINLFIWPAAADAEEGIQARTLKGYHLVHWTSGDLTYWAVSDLKEQELMEFARLIRG
jgi:anti-sigma factor RsiW